MPEDEKITVEGTEHLVNTLNDQAKTVVESLRFVERELAHLNARTAVLNTAKAAYIMELKKHLPIVTN